MGTDGLKEKPTLDELNKALRETYDLFVDRCLLRNFIVLGDTAEGVIKGELYGDKIEVGVEKKYFTEELSRSLDLNGVTGNEADGYSFTVGKVPVKIQVIKKKYKFLENPDFVFYMGDTYHYANPYETYKKLKPLK